MLLKFRHPALLLSLAVLASTPAIADSHGVCPELKRDKVRQIYIFDGKPSELAYLMPDDNEDAQNLYSLSYLYDHGRTVTIRCEYESGTVRDIEFKNRIRACHSSETKSGESRLTCK